MRFEMRLADEAPQGIPIHLSARLEHPSKGHNDRGGGRHRELVEALPRSTQRAGERVLRRSEVSAQGSQSRVPFRPYPFERARDAISCVPKRSVRPALAASIPAMERWSGNLVPLS